MSCRFRSRATSQSVICGSESSHWSRHNVELQTSKGSLVPHPFHLKWRPNWSWNATVLPKQNKIKTGPIKIQIDTYSLNGMILFFNHALRGIGWPIPKVIISDLDSLHNQDAIMPPSIFFTLVTISWLHSVMTWYIIRPSRSSYMFVLQGLSGSRIKVRRGAVVDIDDEMETRGEGQTLRENSFPHPTYVAAAIYPKIQVSTWGFFH